MTFLRLYKTRALYELYLRDPRRQNRLTCRLAPGKLPPYLCGVQKVMHTRAQFISTCAPFDAYKAPPSAACHFKKMDSLLRLLALLNAWLCTVAPDCQAFTEHGPQNLSLIPACCFSVSDLHKLDEIWRS